MGWSSNIYAVALMRDGKVLFAQKEVKVTSEAAVADCSWTRLQGDKGVNHG